MRLFIFGILLVFHLSSFCQTDQNYYLFPINPGKQNYLAGNMGELRSSHFHGGLDIKTGGIEGLPVYAAADGYISRMRVGGSGYGYVLYLTHPNGTTSVYAHLSKFEPALQKYMIDEQYAKETFEIELYPAAGQFSFKRGDVIAYSGNTGSSSGPHLHFEIRDKEQRLLDPLKFNFSEIKDNITPQMVGIAFVTLDGDARVNDTFGRFEFDVLKTNGLYSTRVPITLKGKVGVEVCIYDLMDGVPNRDGVQRATLMIDGDTVFSQYKDEISFDHQRNILVHMDYPRSKGGGPKYNKLFIDDGNNSEFYTVPSKGFNFSDSIHTIRIYLQDSHGNITTFENQVNKRSVVYKPEPKINQFEVYRNHLHFKTPHSGTAAIITAYLGRKSKQITPYRTDHNYAYYLWDLRKGLPDSLDINGKMIETGIYAEIPSDRDLSFYNHDMDLHVYKNSLFDTLYLQFEKGYDATKTLEIFKFPHTNIPLRSSVNVNLKPEKTYDHKKAAVYSSYGGKVGGYVGGKWNGDQISFNTRDLGSFTIAYDSLPPVISARVATASALSFKIYDGRSGIQSFRATLNGKYLLFYYEPKTSTIWAMPKDASMRYHGNLILEVTDNMGNVATYRKTLP